MKKYVLGLAMLTFIVIFTGCATVLSGVSQDITFESSPSGATVYLDGERYGVTPFTATLKKNKFKSFRVELDGYYTISRTLGKEIDLVALLSVFWDLGTTDVISGAVMKYDNNSYFIELQEK